VLVNTIKARFAQVNFKTFRMQATIYLVSVARVKGKHVTNLNCMTIEIPTAISAMCIIILGNASRNLCVKGISKLVHVMISGNSV
jgi:hypothetical protein